MSAAPIPIPQLTTPWTTTTRTRSRTSVLLEALRPADHSGTTIELERCATGRLRNAYPVNTHDIEARIDPTLPGPSLSELLSALATAIHAAEPQCRRIVYAAAVDDPDARAAAEAAGYRHVVDVDLPDTELSLMVNEPAWVTAVDMDLDHVPGT
ncbi:hypothetical protein [Nocardia pseudovaccinii]|uniref:hypothetical protein n=1 Tax=Nocardia pseudovaccinii TaxID=189540 RepID=UPI0007A50BC7|nr:hypothetical protein [Nocardia pseudovaccinii]